MIMEEATWPKLIRDFPIPYSQKDGLCDTMVLENSKQHRCHWHKIRAQN